MMTENMDMSPKVSVSESFDGGKSLVIRQPTGPLGVAVSEYELTREFAEQLEAAIRPFLTEVRSDDLGDYISHEDQTGC